MLLFKYQNSITMHKRNSERVSESHLPIPLSHFERIWLAVCAGSQVFYPPLSQTWSGFNSISWRITHSSKSKCHSDLMDAIENTFQEKLSRLSQVYFFHSYQSYGRRTKQPNTHRHTHKHTESQLDRPFVSLY